MQGLADGYFVIPYTIGDYLAGARAAEGHDRPRRLQGSRRQRPAAASTSCWRSRAAAASARSTASSAGSCGTTSAWRATKPGLRHALDEIPKLRDEFWHNVSVPGTPDNLNQSLEYAGRVADYLEFAELLAARRAAPAGVVRRPLPRGEPDARGRSAARRRAASPTWRPGSSPASAASRCCTRNRWSSRKCTPRSGVTSRPGGWSRLGRLRPDVEPETRTDETHLRIWRQAGPTARGRLVDYAADARLARHVVPRDARRRQRRADPARARTRSPSTRTAAKASAACAASSSNGIPHGPDRGTTVCQLHMRRFKDGDTITIEPWRARAFPGRQGPRRRPQRVRSHHRGRRLRLGQLRRRPRRQRHPDRQGRRPKPRWTRRPASAAARASRPARTRRRTCS